MQCNAILLIFCKKAVPMFSYIKKTKKEQKIKKVFTVRIAFVDC